MKKATLFLIFGLWATTLQASPMDTSKCVDLKGQEAKINVRPARQGGASVIEFQEKGLSPIPVPAGGYPFSYMSSIGPCYKNGRIPQKDKGGKQVFLGVNLATGEVERIANCDNLLEAPRMPLEVKKPEPVAKELESANVTNITTTNNYNTFVNERVEETAKKAVVAEGMNGGGRTWWQRRSIPAKVGIVVGGTAVGGAVVYGIVKAIQALIPDKKHEHAPTACPTGDCVVRPLH